eukprot:PhF_6_TR30591/c0_g1_i1/m.45012
MNSSRLNHIVVHTLRNISSWQAQHAVPCVLALEVLSCLPEQSKKEVVVNMSMSICPTDTLLILQRIHRQQNSVLLEASSAVRLVHDGLKHHKVKLTLADYVKSLEVMFELFQESFNNQELLCKSIVDSIMDGIGNERVSTDIVVSLLHLLQDSSPFCFASCVKHFIVLQPKREWSLDTFLCVLSRLSQLSQLRMDRGVFVGFITKLGEVIQTMTKDQRLKALVSIVHIPYFRKSSKVSKWMVQSLSQCCEQLDSPELVLQVVESLLKLNWQTNDPSLRDDLSKFENLLRQIHPHLDVESHPDMHATMIYAELRFCVELPRALEEYEEELSSLSIESLSQSGYMMYLRSCVEIDVVDRPLIEKIEHDSLLRICTGKKEKQFTPEDVIEMLSLYDKCLLMKYRVYRYLSFHYVTYLSVLNPEDVFRGAEVLYRTGTEVEGLWEKFMHQIHAFVETKVYMEIETALDLAHLMTKMTSESTAPMWSDQSVIETMMKMEAAVYMNVSELGTVHLPKVLFLARRGLLQSDLKIQALQIIIRKMRELTDKDSKDEKIPLKICVQILQGCGINARDLPFEGKYVVLEFGKKYLLPRLDRLVLPEVIDVLEGLSCLNVEDARFAKELYNCLEYRVHQMGPQSVSIVLKGLVSLGMEQAHVSSMLG